MYLDTVRLLLIFSLKMFIQHNDTIKANNNNEREKSNLFTTINVTTMLSGVCQLRIVFIIERTN